MPPPLDEHVPLQPGKEVAPTPAPKLFAVLKPDTASLILAPMDGFTDSPMRALQGESGAFHFGVSEFLRVSANPLPPKVFVREVPELETGGQTSSGMPVQVQILGGDPERMAQTALNALEAGAEFLDINFGCPAPTVNRHDGGATLLRFPERVRLLTRSVRDAVPASIPVSAKIRLGWEEPKEVFKLAEMACEGGADWLVIHARTKTQRYQPPVYWNLVGEVAKNLSIPVVVNGDIWNIEDFKRCRDATNCRHFMLGRGALVNPLLAEQAAYELGVLRSPPPRRYCWLSLLKKLSHYSQLQIAKRRDKTLHRLKQWLNLAGRFGNFPHFSKVKRCQSESEFFECLRLALTSTEPFTQKR